MAGELGGAALEQAGFVQTLDALKQEGSNILLVGPDTADAHAMICQRLLGEPESNSRYRLRVTGGTDRGFTHDSECAHDDGTMVRTIDYSDLAVGSESAVANVSSRTPLGTLGLEIIETVDEFDGEAGGLEPSELRVCVDSLVPLLDEHTPEKVFRLLHMTTSRVVHVHGMGHYHLPLERDHDTVKLFEPMFDAIVEVRARDGSYEQRWQLRDQESATDWLSL